MIAGAPGFYGDPKNRHDVEPICRTLPIADIMPAEYEATYYRESARATAA